MMPTFHEWCKLTDTGSSTKLLLHKIPGGNGSSHIKMNYSKSLIAGSFLGAAKT